MNPDLNALLRLGVALAIGLLIGLDRERAEERKAQAEFAGVRTFPIIALVGCLGAMLGPGLGAWVPAVAFLAVLAITVISYLRSSRDGNVGATTEVAAIVTFLLGATAGAGQLVVAGAAGVAVTVLLVAKARLEAMSRTLTAGEVSAVLELAVISVIVLPILPDRGFGPWGLLNPREMWWIVVLVAGLSFVGFVAVRTLGEQRGLAVTGAVGGLVSSTAVTLAMAERSREEPASHHAAAAAAVLASAVMSGRVLVFAGAVNRGILPHLAPAVVAMLVTGAASAWLIARFDPRQRVAAGDRIRNPFSLKAAISFALIYGVVLLVARGAHEWLGDKGMLAAAALSSVADVDAVTIAITRMGPGETMWRVPAVAITLAIVMNTLIKLGIAVMRGEGSYRRLVARALLAMAASAAVVQAWLFVSG